MKRISSLFITSILVFALAFFLLPCEQAVASEDEGPYIETPYITGDGNQPPLGITVRGEAGLREMLDMVLASDDELTAYLERKGHTRNGMETREDLVTYLRLIDSLPFPVLPNTKLNTIERSVSLYGTSVDVYYDVINSSESTGYVPRWYHFTFYVSDISAKEIVKNETGKDAVPFYQNDNMQIYLSPYISNTYPDIRIVSFFADTNGWFVDVRYRNDDLKSISELDPAQFFEGMSTSHLSSLYPHKAWIAILGQDYANRYPYFDPLFG
ncbi:MAG: hypothetical protein FWG00_06555 [Coriobacteriia bacterium]|nr:hypothetical protein [Coriobacteriia bacterium]